MADDLFTAPGLFESCPACGRRLDYETVTVRSGGDPKQPEETIHRASCECGWHYRRDPESLAKDMRKMGVYG